VEIAASISLTGEMSAFGIGSLEGIQLAVEDANANKISPHIDLKVYDNASSPEIARKIAAQVVASPAVLVIGPSNTTTSLAAGPVYAQAGLASITTTATSDLITDNATTFRVLFKNSEQAEMLATYLFRVLGQKRAAVLIADDGYGRTIEKGFRVTAERLGIDAKYYVFKTNENAEEVARNAATEIKGVPVILGMLDADGARVLTVLRRLGVKGPFLAGDPLAIENFNSRFANLPEEKDHPGYFCEELYAITPMLLDSANADVLSFAERFKVHFRHDPGWIAVAGYDAALAAIQATRAAASEMKITGVPTMRAAALKYLRALTDPRRAPSGLLGPLAFDSARGRQAAIRIGRFNHGRLESAPLQIVSVLLPLEADLKSGAVFEISPGRYVRLQQIIYSGIFLNEIMWIEQARSTFAADFYIWLRFAKNNGPDAADPIDIKFPNLTEGHFDREHPIEEREMADGTAYFLWRVQATFRNNFDLHRYPFDRQTLTMRFVNSREPVNRIVYALDLSAAQTAVETTSNKVPFGTAEGAFDKLSQWFFVGAHQQRENFVARSSLGDPRRVGRENYRELSGYASSVVLQRRSLSTLLKNLVPLFIMTAILYASLHFPSVLVQVKIGVAMTAVLTGMVLLNSVNSQLGAIGYTVAIEYAFYVFFALGLLHVVAVLVAERLRETGRPAIARLTDLVARVMFVGIVFSVVAAAIFYS
jgi:branched-chain amino acid transport system substrate-binding protein